MNKTAKLTITIKGYDEEQRRISGVATTPSVDRTGDIVEPLGAKFAREIPLLLDHESQMRVGRAKLGPASKSGIPFTAWIPKVAEPGILKDRVDLAWQEIKYGLLDTVSIGFRILNDAVERLKEGGLHYLETEILELSLVGIPAQQEARITAVKSAYAKSAPASRDGTSTARARAPQPKGSTMPKAYTQEALAALRESRTTKAARMAEIFEAGITDETRAEFLEIKGEIGQLDDEIAVCEVHVDNIRKAVPVGDDRAGARAAPYGFAKKFKDVEPKFKGEEGLKRLMCQLHSSLDIKQGKNFRKPSQVAESRYGKTNPTLVAIMKANEVDGAGTGGSEALHELVAVDNQFSGDFIDYLYGETVFDKLPLLSVPHNVAIKGLDGAYTGYWVGESKAIPMSQASSSGTSTAPLKVAGLTVLSNELIRDSSPSALNVAGTGLRAALAQVVDTKFFSADAASAGVSPAGILNGLVAISTNGADAESIKTDVKALFAPFITAKNARGFVWVMGPTTALALSLMQNALGQTAFPGVTPTGGTFHGYPVYVGDNIGSGDVILLQPKEIWKIGDLGVNVSISNETMIEQSSAPTGATDTPAAATQAMTSMFQEESTAIKVVRPINWGKRRTSAVAYVGDAAWGAEVS